MELIYLCDDGRHLVCLPYSISNLHRMADDLGIKRCWFHNSSGGRLAHYDLPKRRIAEITARCKIISSRDILRVIKGELTIADIPSL